MKMIIIGLAFAIATPSAAFASQDAPKKECCCCDKAKEKDCCCDKHGKGGDHADHGNMNH